MCERLSLGGVDKWHWAHTGGVKSGKKINCQSKDGYSSRVGFVHEEHGSRPEKHESHTREGSEKKVTPTKGIDCPDSGESEDGVDQPETERCEQTLTSIITSL